MKIDISVLIKICKSLDVDIEMFYKDYLDNNDSDKTESEIMFKYDQLNDDGKAKLNERLDELLELPKYRK